MAWLILFAAGILEVVWALGLKASDGFSRPGPTAVTLVAMIASVVLLAQAVRTLPVGTAYAVWVGIGAVGAVIFGILVYDESVTPMRLGSIALIVLGVLGLRLSG